MPDAQPAAAPSPTPARPPAPPRRWLRRLLWAALALVVVLLGLLASLWWWTGQPQSLPRSLALAQRWLPAGTELAVQDAQGSIRFGGEIGSLRLSSKGLQLTIQALKLDWNLATLWQRKLAVQRLDIAQLDIRTGPSTTSEPSPPLTALHLPLRIDLPVRIGQLTWGDAPNAALHNLQAHYHYDGQQHRVPTLQWDYDQGHYLASAELQAAAPMQLAAQVEARFNAPLPDAAALPLVLHAQAQGKLSGPQGRIALTAQLTEAPPATATATAETAAPSPPTLAADLDATLTPWAAQPLPQATLNLSHINLARLASALPPSDLSGTLQVQTDAAGLWQVHTALRNPQAGPWDAPALPLAELDAQAHTDGSTWRIDQLRWQLPGKSGQDGKDGQDGGQLLAEGAGSLDLRRIQAQVTWQAVNPAQVLAALPAQALTGHLTVQTAEANAEAEAEASTAPNSATAPAIDFTLQLADPHTRTGLRKAQLAGRWADMRLTLHDTQIDALGAQLTSPQLAWEQATQLLTAQAQLTLPGTQAQWQGSLGAQDGQGSLTLALTNAQALGDWLRQLPGLNLPALALDGQAHLQAQWEGGWAGALAAAPTSDADADTDVAANAPAQPPRPLHIQLDASSPRLHWGTAPEASGAIHDLALHLRGPLSALQAQLSGQAQYSAHQVQLDSQASGAWQAGTWQARIDQLALRTQLQGHSQPWHMQLTAPLALQQQPQGLSASASGLDITPPPGSTPASPAHITWQALTVQGGALRSQGRLTDLPLAWVDSLQPNDPPLARAGISGDLVLQGEWDIDTTTAQPRISALLERASGDLRIAAEDESAAPVTVVRSSGTTDARTTTRQPNQGRRVRLQALQLQLSMQAQHQLRAELLWASERAGTIHADLRSPLTRTAQGWQWAERAPLDGSVQLLLPNIGVWASFAPPGWRIAGSFGGDVMISGTRQAPQWRGTLQADDLSISSLLDGVNLDNGQLRARFSGNRLDIDRLYLEGRRGSAARVLGMSGNRTDPPTAGGQLTGSGFIVYAPDGKGHGIQMDVQVQADKLQLLARADRQLGISGQVSARMQDEHLGLRGQLTVDRAALILADESAPSLDEDVHIHSAAQRERDAQAQAQAERKAAREPAPEGSVRAALKPDIQLTLDLGPDFALQGYGLTTRLQGQLAIQGGPRVTGEVHTDQGRFRAWGQALDIENGIVRFNGPYDDPSLDILALRPNIAVRAGVKVAGSASNPRVQLYSDPVLPDAEKLSWVVMGRDPAEGGAETAMLQQAALALLSGSGGGGNFAGQIGLDEIGFKGAGNGAEGAALTLGKRISQDLYLSYEQSLDGAMGTLFIFYDLTKRLTLRGQTGEQTAMDLIYTRRKD